jgi:superkiller protein 3
MLVLGVGGLLQACNLTCSQEKIRALEHMNRAVELSKQQLYESAVKELKLAIALYPTLPEAYYNLGKIYQQQKKWAEAAEAFTETTKLTPTSAMAHYDLGAALLELNRPEVAVKEFEAAIGQNATLYKAYFRLGEAHQRLDRPREADAAYRKAVELNPRFIRSFLRLAALYLGYGYAAEAVQVLSNAERISSDDPAVHYQLGYAMQEMGNFQGAAEHYERCLALDRDNYDAMFSLGVALSEVGEQNRAGEVLTRFVQRGGGNRPDAVRAANEILSKLGSTAAP